MKGKAKGGKKDKGMTPKINMDSPSMMSLKSAMMGVKKGKKG